MRTVHAAFLLTISNRLAIIPGNVWGTRPQFQLPRVRHRPRPQSIEQRNCGATIHPLRSNDRGTKLSWEIPHGAARQHTKAKTWGAIEFNRDLLIKGKPVRSDHCRLRIARRITSGSLLPPARAVVAPKGSAGGLTGGNSLTAAVSDVNEL